MWEDDPTKPDGIAHQVVEDWVRDALSQMALASVIDHPGEKGRAREAVLREFVARAIPPGFATASGFVIDVHGAVSRQQDIVVYRRDYHPIFPVGGVAYFPVEAVVACIEVKSNLTSKEMQSALANGQSVKALDRSGGGTNYCVLPGGLRAGDYDGALHEHQVLTMVMAGEAISWETLKGVLTPWLADAPREQWPNLIAVAERWSVTYETLQNQRPRVDTMAATGLRLSRAGEGGNADPLNDALEQLWSFLRVAPIIDVHPNSYVRGCHSAQERYPFAEMEHPPG